MHTLMFIIGRMGRLQASTAANLADETATLSNDKIILKVLTQADADVFFRLYFCGELDDAPAQCPILPDDTPESFALRTVAACELIWTVRLAHDPTVIIGDCTLHHWEKEKGTIEFGGTLLPRFRGQGIMQATHQLVAEHSMEQFGVNSLVCINGIY